MHKLPDELLSRARAFVKVQRYAEIAAHVAHFGTDRASLVAERFGLSSDRWYVVEQAWLEELAQGMRRQQREQALKYSATFAQTRLKLQREQPALGAVGPGAGQVALDVAAPAPAPQPSTAPVPPGPKGAAGDLSPWARGLAGAATMRSTTSGGAAYVASAYTPPGGANTASAPLAHAASTPAAPVAPPVPQATPFRSAPSTPPERGK